MKFPLLVITYGAFGADQKKIFFIEDKGVSQMPVFSDPVVAARFCNGWQEAIKEFGDDRTLVTQVCNKPEHAKDMFMVISTMVPELTTIIFDPSPPQGITEEMFKAKSIPRNDIRQIDDVIEELERIIGQSPNTP